MKAPYKITIDKYNITDKGDVVFAWLTNSPDCEPINHPVEYVRADAFIEKACGWLKEIFSEYENLTDYNPTEDFKNYMKGERL